MDAARAITLDRAAAMWASMPAPATYAVAVGRWRGCAVMLDGGGTGKFWGIVLWRNVKGAPAYVGTVDIGDRTPIEEITIGAVQAQVVYLTRPDDASMVELVIKRTASASLV
ncbi:hypothetical protein [Micromonospora echinofusca]|uniref:Uncharacterized protein n=1 Tax=Micromonospora echinofusca TaxID=47858 RepID=A0ABS3VVT8_MICEH|nr:hypothetical protein [Micromonospora echinofusca]MBO4208637.1 hypothetical protein [Micromonospora echinofusca]